MARKEVSIIFTYDDDEKTTRRFDGDDRMEHDIRSLFRYLFMRGDKPFMPEIIEKTLHDMEYVCNWSVEIKSGEQE